MDLVKYILLIDYSVSWPDNHYLFLAMIKCFAQICRSFLMDNKTLTYLKFAIAEILFVMAGILVAQ